MKIAIFSLTVVLTFIVLQAYADTPAPVPASVAVSVPAPSSPLMGSGLILTVIMVVSCLNILLSAVQELFSKLSKTEPGWLQTVSSIVLSISKYLGSNPDVAAKIKPPAQAPKA